MTADQKQSVTALRQQGYGYLRIANELGLTVSSVKGFCQRNERTEVCTADTAQILVPPTEVQSVLVKTTEPTTDAADCVCKGCGTSITQTLHARKKLFCSTACRQKWWNEHLECVNRKAVYDFTCITCGKAFTAYGKKDRKYCCHECYIADRFGRRRA